MWPDTLRVWRADINQFQKRMKKSFLLLVAAAGLLWSASTTLADNITLTLNGSVTNYGTTLAVQPGQMAEVKSFVGMGGGSGLMIQKDGMQWNFSGGSAIGFKVVGPAQLFLLAEAPAVVMATIEITPSAFPPDKAVTVGPYSGNVQVTLESSTDLVNWAPAVSGATYTNTPDARFFRINVQRNAPPPPITATQTKPKS